MTTRGHEQTDLEPKYVVYFAVALVLVGLVVYVGIWWMFRQFEQEQASRKPQAAPVAVVAPMPEPRLQISPQGDLEELRRQEEEILSTYQWIDRNKRTARIPINRAMDLFLMRQALLEKARLERPPAATRPSPFVRGTIPFSPLQRGRAAEGGRGSLTNPLEDKPPRQTK